MNHITFSGKLIADARTAEGKHGNFISFMLYETGKGLDASKLECTQNYKGESAPSIIQHLKKSATVIVLGTPYAKIGKDREKREIPVLACFVEKIDIIAFAISKQNEEGM
jgi:hypothetical protein